MKNKSLLTAFYISFFVFTVIIIFVVIFLRIGNNKAPKNPNQFPTPTIFQLGPKGPIKVTDTSPKNQAINVPTDSSTGISYTLSQPVSITAKDLSVYPNLIYTYETKNNQIVIHPEQSLQPSTRYSVTLQIKQPDGTDEYSSFSFITAGPTPTPLNLDQNNGQMTNDMNNYIKQNRPDLLLVNNLPHQTADFSASYQSFPDKPFLITVTLLNSDKNAAKQAFVNWAISLGMTNAQFQTLNINYQ